MGARIREWLGWAALACLLAESALAQGSCDFSRPAGASSKGSSAASGQQQDVTGTTAPTRVIEDRTESGNRTVVRRTLEGKDVNGGYAPIAVCETETVKVDANTQRVTQRSYGVDNDRRRFLIEATEEQTRKSANGGEDVTRTISQPDPSGQVRVARREVEQVRALSPNIRESRTTVLLPDANGGLAPNAVIREVRTQQAPGVEQVRRTQMLPDGNGGWQTGEVREKVIRTDAKGNRTEDERVFRPDANLKMSLSTRTVTRETKAANGTEQKVVNTYGPAIAGSIDSIDLDSSMKVVRSTLPGGRKETQTQVDTHSPIAPADGLRTAGTTVEVAQPNQRGGSETRRSKSVADPNGNQTQITVDFSQQQPKK